MINALYSPDPRPLALACAPIAGTCASSKLIAAPRSTFVSARQQIPNFPSIRVCQCAYHTATLLNNGEILFAGGESDTQLLPDSGSILASAELFDPGSGQFAATASMNVARTGHTATLLSDGSVLVAGGRGAAGILADAEVFRLK